VRIAVAGSHSVGKSTLIAGFLGRHAEYAHEPEAFEVLGDDIELTESGAPTADGLRLLLDHTLSAVEGRAGEERVIFERSPVDYLAYAAASVRAWEADEVPAFLRAHRARVREAIRHLDVIAYLPLAGAEAVRRRGEGKAFRRRVDHCLRRALLDDRHRLFAEGRPPCVVALPFDPERQLEELSRLVEADDGVRAHR
jgi:hypothetical protein